MPANPVYIPSDPKSIKPRTRKPVVLERHVENAFLRLLKNYDPDAEAWKCNGLGHAARPDRQIVMRARLVCWIEFKRPGEYPTKAQGYELDYLEALGHYVAACDDPEHAMDFIRQVRIASEVPNGRFPNWRLRWIQNHK